MFLLVRLLRPWIARASGRSVVAPLAALGVGTAILVALGLTLTARVAWRGRGARSAV